MTLREAIEAVRPATLRVRTSLERTHIVRVHADMTLWPLRDRKRFACFYDRQIGFHQHLAVLIRDD